MAVVVPAVITAASLGLLVDFSNKSCTEVDRIMASSP